MVNRVFTNISNYFTDTNHVGDDFEKVMEKDCGYIFGLEVQRDEGYTSFTLVTPPSIRLDEPSQLDRLIETEDDWVFYEGVLAKPHFMNINMNMQGWLIQDLFNLNTSWEDKVVVQLLFKKKRDYWKYNAHDMFGSYLRGSEQPFTSRIARTIQDKMLHMLDGVLGFDSYHEYIDDVESKLLSEAGYQFTLRVAIQSSKFEEVKNEIQEALAKYTSHNAIKLIPVKDKYFHDHFLGCSLVNSETQILCKEEVLSLFSAYSQKPQEAPKPAANVNAYGAIKLFPEWQRKAVEVDGNIVNRLAEAMKRIGLISQARVYNESVIAGIRLQVVQCDIPKGKIFTQLEAKARDIAVEMGVPTLGVDAGEGGGTVRFSIPLEEPVIISLREVIESAAFLKFAKENPLAFIVGVDETNNPIYLDLTQLVHLLIAGTTGSGKSVFLNSLLLTLIATHTPEEIRMIMIDPKQVELQQYVDFPHVDSVVTDMDEAEKVFADLVKEMERRYTEFKEAKVKEIAIYNKKNPDKKMPYIICVVDEYADLKDTNPDVDKSIKRLGQKARAAGIHLIIATQRPSAKVLDGTIKANIQNAISFNLGTNTNYRTVFGTGIPYKLLGNGDGVMKIEGYPKPFQRFQSAMFCPEKELEGEYFDKLIEYYSGAEVEPVINVDEDEEEAEEGVVSNLPEESPLDRIKKYIAQTGETKTEAIRSALSMKKSTVSGFMLKLVEQGWLIKHKSQLKGYELVATEEMMAEYKE